MNVLIEKQIYGGNGLGHMADGKAIMIPFTIDGELLAVRDVHEKNKSYIGSIDQIINPSEHRIEPPCPQYAICGGCQYQHIAYQHQLFLKKEILRSQMERLGGLKQVAIENTVPSEYQFAYRNHVQFHLDPDGKPGFQQARSHDVIPINSCLLLEKTLNDLLGTLVFEPESGIERVAFRDDGIGTPLLFLTGESMNPPDFEVDFPLNVVYRGPAGEMMLSGISYNQFDLLSKTFQVSARSFFQNNRLVVKKMVQLLLEEIPNENHSIIDCYCGVGFFSAFLAERAEHLIGIESCESACNDFAINLDPYDHVELFQGNAEDVLPELDIHTDLMVIDPPRAGIFPKALNAIIKMRPLRIVYISCDPATLARDLKTILQNGYHLEKLIPIDMFPQTYHIESMAFLKSTK